MRTGLSEARAAIVAGLAFAPRGLAAAWTPVAVSTAGLTALFVAGQGSVRPEAAPPLAAAGLSLYFLMLAPKLGALHRSALGTAEGLEPGGLQWGRTEWRLLSTAVALGGFALLLASAAAATLVVLSAAGLPRDGLALALAIASLAALGVLGRLAVTLAADACEPHPRFIRGWLLTRGLGVGPGLAFLALTVAPAAAGLALLAACDRLAVAAPGPAARLEGALAAFAVAALSQGLAAPASAGALAWFHRRGSARGAEHGAGARGVRAVAPTRAGASPAAPEPPPA